MTIRELKELLGTMCEDREITFVNSQGKELEIKDTTKTNFTNELIFEIE